VLQGVWVRQQGWLRAHYQQHQQHPPPPRPLTLTRRPRLLPLLLGRQQPLLPEVPPLLLRWWLLPCWA
jgi:hypothetical protein